MHFAAPTLSGDISDIITTSLYYVFANFHFHNRFYRFSHIVAYTSNIFVDQTFFAYFSLSFLLPSDRSRACQILFNNNQRRCYNRIDLVDTGNFQYIMMFEQNW
jgi:hypothetical protein